MTDEPTIRIRDGSMVTREQYDLMEAQAKRAANRQVNSDSSRDYSELVERLRDKTFKRCGPTIQAVHTKTIEWEAADALEAKNKRIALYEKQMSEFAERSENDKTVLRARIAALEAAQERLVAALVIARDGLEQIEIEDRAETYLCGDVASRTLAAIKEVIAALEGK